MKTIIIRWVVIRLREKTTWIGLALASAAYFGVEIKDNCEGVKLCITKDMWARIMEAGWYMISAAFVFYNEKPPVIEQPETHNSDLERVQKQYPDGKR